MTQQALVATELPSSFLDLYRAPGATREAILRGGQAPPFEDLVGWEYNGLNVGAVAGGFGLNRKFRKGFYRGPSLAKSGPEPFIQGYNIPAHQDALDKPHRAKPSDEQPKRFGFYRVYSAAQSPRFNHYPQALLLDYGAANNGPIGPGVLRDYLVQVRPGDSNLLLGKAWFTLGPIAFPVGFFVLERARQHTFAG